MKQKTQTELKFKKEELLQAECYQDRKDLVGALLVEGRAYSLTEVDAVIERFMKGKVK